MHFKASIKPIGPNDLLFTPPDLDSSQEDKEVESNEESWDDGSIQHFSQYDSHQALVNNTFYVTGMGTAGLHCLFLFLKRAFHILQLSFLQLRRVFRKYIYN